MPSKPLTRAEYERLPFAQRAEYHKRVRDRAAATMTEARRRIKASEERLARLVK